MKRLFYSLILGLFAIATPLLLASIAHAQPIIRYLSPDAAAPGMTVAVEIYAPYDHPGSFGTDGFYPPDSIVRIINVPDRSLVQLGPSIVSWNGRLIQVMILVQPNATIGEVPMQVVIGNTSFAQFIFSIVAPRHIGNVTGGGFIGQGGLLGLRTPRNVMIVDSLILENGTYTVSKNDPDADVPGNQAYLPFRVLSMGPIRLNNATLSVAGSDAVTRTSGGSGGPGGGGGGSGYPGSGGDGYTGGGGEGESSSPGTTHGGVGTGSDRGSHYYDGGKGLTDVPGGGGLEYNGSFDEGGGGGTGHPFGLSGTSGTYNQPSLQGGYGAGSGGGSITSSTNFGGGGGGNATAGVNGQSQGSNGGQITGNAMLIPLAGGSGGGSGNVTQVSASNAGGSGGGGGGAVELTAFTQFMLPNGSILAQGGNGSAGTGTLFSNGAGGGGGSGGAIVISARDSIGIGTSSSSPAFNVSGGNGASGSVGNEAGGAGGAGRVRFNGYVSKVGGNPSSSNFFTSTRDYTGPSIQRVDVGVSTFQVFGYGVSWDNPVIPANSITVYYYANSLPAWQSVTVTPSLTASSHTAGWSTPPIPIPLGVADSQIFVVAVQTNPVSHTTYTDVPEFAMSHTSGYITRVVFAPKMLVTKQAIDFGKVRVGLCSRDTTVYIYSTGRANLIVNSLNIAGPDAAYFSVQPTAPQTIKPGDSLAMTLRFCPDILKCPMNATLEIGSNDVPASVPLVGCAIQGKLSVRDTALNFGSVSSGDCRDTSIYVHNIGTDTLFMNGARTLDTRFKVVRPSGSFFILPQDSVEVVVEYCGSDSGSFTASLLIIPVIGRDTTVSLSAFTGRGALQIPAIIDFGSVEVGSCKDTLVGVTNIGTDSITVQDVGVITPPFTYVGPKPSIKLGAGQSTLVQLRFCPTVEGPESQLDQLSVSGEGSVNPATLRGNGIRGALTTSGPIDLGCVIVGTTLERTILLTNTGAGQLQSVNTTISGSPDFSLGLRPHSTIASGQKDSVQVLFTATTFGDQLASVTITYNSGATQTIPVSAHVSPAPKITMLDSTLKFDTLLIGDVSASQCLRITNYSCVPLDARSLGISSNTGSFEIVSSDAPASLVDSAIVTICVRFVPKRNGADTGRVWFFSGTDTTFTTILSGYGKSPVLGVVLSIDTVTGRPGDVVTPTVRVLNDITVAGITSITFRVQFDPMQLDLRAPTAGTIKPNGASYSVKKYSLGDQEITVTSTTPFEGHPVIARLPFEVLMATRNQVPIHIVSASFAQAPAVLSSSGDGLVRIEQCDTTSHVAVRAAQVTVAQNTPNPFNPQTSVTLHVFEAGHVKLGVYNALGERVLTALDQDLGIGEQRVTIDAAALPSGVYHYVTEWTGASGTLRDRKSMILTK